jgi:nitroimidazol reductase NimA-like FMN-containing flavoprotein (pyridoxamine 5'-phosphate oxidase superfamily)
MALSEEEKQTVVEDLLTEAVLARIGTARNNQPHVVSVWFLWDGEAVWISAFSGTRKVKELRANPKLAILIEPRDLADSPIQAVLFEGPAEVIAAPRELVEEMALRIYTRYMGPEGVLAPDPQSWIVDPENTLIKLIPSKKYVW